MHSAVFAFEKVQKERAWRCKCRKQDQTHFSGLAKCMWAALGHPCQSIVWIGKGLFRPLAAPKRSLKPTPPYEPNFSDCKLGLPNSTRRVIASCRFPWICNLTVWGLRRHNLSCKSTRESVCNTRNRAPRRLLSADGTEKLKHSRRFCPFCPFNFNPCASQSVATPRDAPSQADAAGHHRVIVISGECIVKLDFMYAAWARTQRDAEI